VRFVAERFEFGGRSAAQWTSNFKTIAPFDLLMISIVIYFSVAIAACEERN